MIDDSYELSPIGQKIVAELAQTDNCTAVETFMKQFKSNSDLIYHSYLELDAEFRRERQPEEKKTIRLTHGDEILLQFLEKSTHQCMSMHEPLSNNLNDYLGMYGSLKRVANPEVYMAPPNMDNS